MVVWRGEEEPRTASAGAVANLGPYTTKGYLKGTPLWDLFFWILSVVWVKEPQTGAKKAKQTLIETL